MTFREANMEGQTPGTTVGVANSSAFGDDPFTIASISAMTMQYGNTAMHGTGGISVGAGTNGSFAQIGWSGFSNAKAATRFYLRLRNYPVNEFQLAHFFASATQVVSAFNITPTGLVKVVVGPTSNLIYTSATVINLNTWYRLEFATTVSATAGQVKFAAYLGDNGTTPVTGLNYDSGTALNSGTAPITLLAVGKITSSATTGAFDLDDFAMNDGLGAFIGPFASVAPTPKLALTTGSAVLDCTGSTVGQAGDTLTFSIAPSAGTSQPARGIFVVPQQADAVTYTVSVLESNGQSKTSTAVVPGLSQTTSTATQPKVFTNGQWQ